MSENVNILTPVLPESVRDGVVAKWLKSVGDSISFGEPLLELETDKVVLEIPSSATGVLQEILIEVGTSVKSGEILGSINTSTAHKADENDVQMAQIKDQASLKVETIVEALDDAAEDVECMASPSQRQTAYENGQSLDDMGLCMKHKHMPAAETSLRDEPSDYVREPLSRMRKTISSRLLEVTRNTAMLTTFNDVNMSSIMDLRSTHQEKFKKEYNIKLGFMSFFIKAVASALKKYPILNASLDGDDVLYHSAVHMSVAVSTDRGLVVPVIRNCADMSFHELEASLSHLASLARSNQLSMDDLSGGTFTITNGGVFGSMLSTPLINPPQSAILGMHRIDMRPVVIDGEIAIAPMMYVALSYDHCLIDGKDAVGFLSVVKSVLESPDWLMFS